MRLIAYYAHPERGRKHEREDAARILNEFQRYYVTRVAVGQSYTRVWLYGFKQEIGQGFNSVFFDFYCEETKRCVDVPYELERPTVLGLFDVSELSVRRSEDTERTAASRHESINDLIRRTDAIERVELITKCEWDNNVIYRDEVIDALKFAPSADRPTLNQTDTLIIADALRYLAEDEERHEFDRTRAEELRKQILQYGASMCHPAEAVQGWIPCSERLPDIGDRCLVTLSNNVVAIGTLHSAGECEDDFGYIVSWGNRWHLEPASMMIAYPEDSVVAWMPLPKPYREESEVEE